MVQRPHHAANFCMLPWLLLRVALLKLDHYCTVQPLFHLPQNTVDDIMRVIKCLKFPATIQALLHITICTAVAMNKTFSFPTLTTYRAAKYQRVFDLSMPVPGRPSPSLSVRHGVTLFQAHPDEPLHLWRGLNLYLTDEAEDADDSACVVILEFVWYRLGLFGRRCHSGLVAWKM